MTSDSLYEQVRWLVRLARSKFVSVTFIKMDGSERRMVFQPLYVAYIKGPLALPSAQQAVETRRTNNPNLLNVWDVHKRAARSVNMDTILTIKVKGMTFTRTSEGLVQVSDETFLRQ